MWEIFLIDLNANFCNFRFHQKFLVKKIIGGGVRSSLVFYPHFWQHFVVPDVCNSILWDKKSKNLFIDVSRLSHINISLYHPLHFILHTSKEREGQFLKFQKSYPPLTPKKTNYVSKRISERISVRVNERTLTKYNQPDLGAFLECVFCGV